MIHVKRAEGLSVCWESDMPLSAEHDVDLTGDPVVSDCPRCLWMLIRTTTETLAAMAKRMEKVVVTARDAKRGAR